MIEYKNYEKKVYKWLMSKHEKDNNFTFSLRRNATKGSETDYFIGSAKSKYFGMTFWTMPAGYPGSANDCIDLWFKYDDDNYKYEIALKQTNSPGNLQNELVLELLQSLKEPIKEKFILEYETNDTRKIFAISTKSPKVSYKSLDEMLIDIDKDLNVLLPMVDEYIKKIKGKNPELNAHRITQGEFKTMHAKMERRFEKHKSKLDEKVNVKREFINWLKNKPKSKYFNNDKETLNRYLDKYNTYFGIDIFKVSKSNYKNVIDAINQVAYIDEDSEFFKFSDGESNHRPRAILGKTNYFMFLNKKFDNEDNQNEINLVGNSKKNPINQILYGPPGTGKTFYFKDELFKHYTIKETSISPEKNFEETVSKLTWWQVIAISLLEIGTARVNDILENRWVSKKASLSESKNVRATLWGTLQMHTIIESQNVKYTQRQAPLIFDKNEDKSWSLLDNELQDQAPELNDILNNVNNFEANPNTVIKNYDFVTFHQSFAYEDFIEGIKPIIPELDIEAGDAKDLGYTIEDGVFKNLCKRAKNDPENRYAIFIDEINRGNVSAIFGELITLIEVDKRTGANNELSIKLPYSKKDFSVPSNLDIYGTMNTADRSVEALDTALRRRFEFKEMMPNYDVITNEKVEGISLSEVLKRINQRIELLIDRDHTIGHSYFVGVNTAEKLANAFNNRIVPLLQEYFYGDYGKIGLVLGDGFVDINKNDKVTFTNFAYENANDFKTISYTLKQVDAVTVLDAVTKLLNKKEESI